jgi:probable phosphoglycerate mutase
MRLILIRHAVTAETGTVLSGRTPGIPLSEEGRAMAETLAAGLGRLRPAAVVTSPIERCKETAVIVAGRLGQRVRTQRAFIEADYGAWTGRSLRSLRKLKAWNRLMVSAGRFRFPEGETLHEVQQRAVAAVERLAADHPRGTVIVVSHADVIRCVLAHYLGMGIDLIHRLHVAPASASVVVLGPEAPPMVPAVNQQFQEVFR